jgi:hypothetical protein
VRIGIAPELGEDNADVLTRPGHSAEQIRDFRTRKII